MAGRPKHQQKIVAAFEERARKLWQEFAAAMPSQYQDESKLKGPTSRLWHAAYVELCGVTTTFECLSEALDARVRSLSAGVSDTGADDGDDEPAPVEGASHAS